MRCSRALGPRLEGHPQALLAYRLIDIAIASLGFAALLGLGSRRVSRATNFTPIAVPLACIPVLMPIAGAVNNDNLAFLGGAVAMLGAWQLVATGRGRLARASRCRRDRGGLGQADRAPAHRRDARRRHGLSDVAPALALDGLIAARTRVRARRRALFHILRAIRQPDAADAGADRADARRRARRRLGRPAAQIFCRLLGLFRRRLHRRLDADARRAQRLQYAMLAIPVAALVCALAGIALSVRRLWRRQDTALDVVVIAGTLALIATFAIHVSYSYGRHLATGWLMDAYPRYYLPLAADRAARRAVAARRRRNAALARRAAGVPDRRPGRLSRVRRAARVTIVDGVTGRRRSSRTGGRPSN